MKIGFGMRHLKDRHTRRFLLGWVLGYRMVQGHINMNLPKIPKDQRDEYKKRVKDAAADQLFFETIRQDDYDRLRRGISLLAVQRGTRSGIVLSRLKFGETRTGMEY
jgi:hypothetical protein